MNVWHNIWQRRLHQPLSWYERFRQAWDLPALTAHMIQPYIITSTVLDIGCGPGDTLRFCRIPGQLILLDSDVGALELAKQHHMTAWFVRANAFALPFKARRINTALSVGLLEHFMLPEQAALLREMYRIAERVIICVPCGGWAYNWGKAVAEREGTWDIGYESPISTLPAFMQRRYGCLVQLYHLMYVVRRWPIIKRVLLCLVLVINIIGWKLNYFQRGGFWIMGTFISGRMKGEHDVDDY